MTDSRQYDTVAFDVRDNAAMLFFAATDDSGEISDYLLLMRTIEEDFEESFYIEINERQFGGHDPLREAELTGNVLTLRLNAPQEALGGRDEIVLTWAGTPENMVGIETGAFRVLGNKLVGASA